MSDLAWAVAKDLVTWVQRARGAARTRREQRYALVVEHAGVLVAGLRRLNGTANLLLRPLAYFDATTWERERRETLATNLVLFAHEDIVLPRMRASLAALGPACDALKDPEVLAPAREILDRTASLFDLPGGVAPGSVPELTTGHVLENALGMATGTRYLPDIPLQEVVGELVDVLRHAETADEGLQIRELASSLLEGGDGSVLAPHAEATQELFGRLLVYQQRLFPGMPSPDWVWSS